MARHPKNCPDEDNLIPECSPSGSTVDPDALPLFLAQLLRSFRVSVSLPETDLLTPESAAAAARQMSELGDRLARKKRTAVALRELFLK